jgi:excinuclease ABC subunit C
MSVLEGKKGTIEKDIDKDMRQASENQQFEEAAVLRNQLRALKEIGRAVIFSDKEFLDISKDRALTQLMELFGLAKMPVRIEGYDISHMSGRDVVASMVVFTNGVSDKSRYRKFKMSRQTNDDAGNIFESISRRLSQKNSKDWGLPDLMLIDGGKPQLSAALKVLETLGLSIPCISVAKRDEEIIVHKNASNIDTSFLQRLQDNPAPGVSVRNEGDFLVVNLHVGQVNASSHSKNLRGGMTMSLYNDVVKLFQRIRDEAHRFAVSYHTNLKRARQTKSSLEDIPGVGAVTKRKLLKHFGSVRGVEQAQKAAIEKIVGTAMAGKIYRYLH